MTAGADGDAIAEQAAHWLVLLGADDAFERMQAREGYAAWRAADPRHAAAAADMEALLDRLQGLRGTPGVGPNPARAALDAAHAHARAQRRTRRAGIALALAVLLGAPTWLALHTWPLDVLSADLRTGSGERHTVTLPDGSLLTLDSGSAVDVRFDGRRRAIALLEGDILVSVAKDPAHPFIVETEHGSMRALGTRFTVAHARQATTLAMLESSVAVRSRTGGADTVVRAGQQVRMSAAGVGPVEKIDAGSVDDAWRQRKVVANDRPLGDVLAQLARHRSGWLRFSEAELAGIRVSAVLPLDDTDGALRLLQANFPQLRVRRLTRWVVTVDLRP